MGALSDAQRATLVAFVDTVVPAVAHEPDPTGFWARRASDVGTHLAVEAALAGLPEEDAAGLAALLDALAAQGFATLSQRSREQVITNLSLASGLAAAGLGILMSLTQMTTYAVVDPRTGRNPSWDQIGYPGPISPPPQDTKTLHPEAIDGDTDLEADVVVIGSGAGGGVIAARLATQGLAVVVIEAGGYHDESDFNQQELWGFQNLYWRGGPTPTADFNVALQAGQGLGGGTVVNWTNCLRTKPWVREQWARDFGLADVATDAFDRHLDAVWERLGVNDRCSELNASQQAMKRGAERLGWSFRTVHRNWDPARHDPQVAGLMGFGDQSGAKRSSAKTYLQDAADRGARLLVRTFVERVLVEHGRAAGVIGTHRDPLTGASATVTVRAPQVVVAAGALESPAVLLRSGIGGPAVGDYLRLHPCTATSGDYGEDMRSWWGAPHAGLVDEHADLDGEGYGFLIEGVQYTTGLSAAAVPFTTAAAHKATMAEAATSGSFIGLVRDRGHGRVTLDARGQAQVGYAMAEPDRRHMQEAVAAQVRVHVAAGARRVGVLAAGAPTWRVGDDVEAFLASVSRIPMRAGGYKLFSAHQMGTCRMGADPSTSVADPHGQLHDTPGVWVGDGSAFPTPSGTNPMITIMALASRTADHIAASAGARTTEAMA